MSVGVHSSGKGQDFVRFQHDDDDLDGRKVLKEDGLSFEELFQQSMQSDFREGTVTKGKIIAVGSDYVTVDIGYKSEGLIPIQEFYGANNVVQVKVDDEVNVYIDRIENEMGMMILSKDKADLLNAWDAISAAAESNQVIEGTIIGKVKGGLSVDIGVKAFLPGSQVDIRPARNLDQYIGQKHKFKVIKFNKKRGNIVLSRRVLLEQERESMRSELLHQLKDGATVEGIVKNLTEYGAFIDLGGVDGLLHITDMSWGRIKHPNEILNVGDKIQVMVLKYDQEKERVSLGLKQLQEDPWLKVPAKYAIGTRLKGKVVSLADYGAFVELEGGVEGLVHVSEMSWTQRVKHPSKIMNVGDEVEAVVLDLDLANRRISLGTKQMEPNPWTLLEEKYPAGTRIRGQVRNVTDFGVFIGIEEGIDGLVHISDLTWDQNIKHPGEVYKKGDEVDAIVLSIDRENERFSLGVKQMQDDPWEAAASKYIKGTLVEGKVTKITDFGVFLQLEPGIEGLIHVSELSNERVESAKSFCKAGDRLKAEVLNMDPREHKISLSIKQIGRHEDEKAARAYLDREEANSGTSLADSLDQKTSERLKGFVKKET
jgi:small subunit ribosomal protein S1